ncbi:hypothetical protein SCLCIDRAFT_474779 [Scleroderma citrinum Foug A]|uniref:Ubinuclein middle domain-containing protein n=1 Tax=Scleroderma citrinum Foug A TaxID=1036808 RepID=A0A0C3AKR7_9AGAM|nr:hypothetical protein SCLCIDRAFT_474779 [Scleroderma citrinum Foug A]
MASPSEDIEMRDAKDLLSLSPRGTAFVDAVIRPVTEVHTLSSHENSPEPTADHDIHTLVSDVDNDLKPPPSKKIKTSQSPPGSKPISAAGAGTTAKPKSVKAPRARSRSPTPPPQRQPPLQTIRLDIVLGGPDKYEVDITSLAKATGQRPTTPPPPKPDTSDSDGEETDRAKPKKKKKHHASEYYDVNDPFIDDSELNVDNRTHFAQTKQQGFYVSRGVVVLMSDSKSSKKPKSKKAAPAQAGPSKEEDGSKDQPISLLGEDKVDKKRKNYTIIEENGKKRKVLDIREFEPELQDYLNILKAHIAQQDWSNKGKFPADLKPILAEVALKAIELGEYDDDFFNLMPVLFPYNRFTMMKLIKRTVFQDHHDLLVKRQDDLLEQLAKLTTLYFPKAQEEWEKSVAAWHRRHERAKAATAETGGASTPSAGDTAHQEDSGMLSGGEGNDTENAPGTGKPENSRDAHPPAKKYRLTEEMRSIIWRLVMLSNECCRLENEKHELEVTGQQVSEQGSRKALYQKIVAAFPPGWLNSGQISREVSAMKKKMERDTAASDEVPPA